VDDGAVGLQPTSGAPLVAGGRVRMFPCQDKFTNEFHWVPEYRLRFSLQKPTVTDGQFVTLEDSSKKLSIDRGLARCEAIESLARDKAPEYEQGGFLLGILGAGSTAAFTGLAARGGNSSGDTAAFATSAGLSAAVTIVGVYLLARAADSWSAFGASNAAVSQMKPNDPDGNWGLCAAAIQAWTTGRAASETITVSGGAGGGNSGSSGGGGAAAAAAGPATPSGSGSNWPTCPSDVEDLPGLIPPRPVPTTTLPAGH
jgi:hypothetical protein